MGLSHSPRFGLRAVAVLFALGAGACAARQEKTKAAVHKVLPAEPEDQPALEKLQGHLNGQSAPENPQVLDGVAVGASPSEGDDFKDPFITTAQFLDAIREFFCDRQEYSKDGYTLLYSAEGMQVKLVVQDPSGKIFEFSVAGDSVQLLDGGEVVYGGYPDELAGDEPKYLEFLRRAQKLIGR